MSMVDEALEILAEAFGAIASNKVIGGRICDQIGVPLPGAKVRLVKTGLFSGQEFACAGAASDGNFQLDGTACPPEYLVVVEVNGVLRRLVETRRPPFSLGEVRILLPLSLTASIGDGGDNRPYDLRRVQDRMHRLGRLSDDDVTAEPIDLAASPPVTPGPRLMAALARHFTACLGRPLPNLCIEPGSPAAAALTADPPFPLTRIGLSSAVGDLPGADATVARNAPTSFSIVQDRLYQLGLLTRADAVAEYTDPTSSGPVDLATKPRTQAAITTFDSMAARGSLHAIVPGAFNERVLNDPFVFGRKAIRLSGTVGLGGANAAGDVWAVQDALWELGLLPANERASERPQIEGHIPQDLIPSTIAQIQMLRLLRLREPAPAPGLLDLVDQAVVRLNSPARLELTDTVDWNLPVAAANRPADVRRLQDRLLWLGFLLQADYDRECADPSAEGRIDMGDVAVTAGAQAGVLLATGPIALTAAVGKGAANAPADVRALQDRLHDLRFLANADYERERVDPAAAAFAGETALAATFAAIEQVRQRIFGLPAAADGKPWTAQPVVEPGDETHGFLADPLYFGRHPLELAGSVGTFGWNFPTDVRALQERLHAMRLLSDADYTAELADPLRPGRVPDLQISATREAIRRFRESLLGESAPVLERVEPRSPALCSLEDRLGALCVPLELTGSVGYNGDNDPADVLLVQRRLHGLGLLADQDFELESQAVPATGENRLRDAQIAQTISAIGSWQRLMVGGSPEPRVEPFSETRYTLSRPVIPRSVQLTLTGRVGRGGANSPGDVRQVQDRLFELGVLDALDYYSERVDAAAAGPVSEAALPATIPAIGRLEETLAGLAAKAPDFVVSAGGRVQRILEEPAFSTPTAPNPNCTLTSAGPERPTFSDADLMRIVRAIEAAEGGVSTGEIPAILRNASQTAASWGASQVIGGTGLDKLKADLAFAALYGLTSARLGQLSTRAAAAGKLLDDITAALPTSVTEATLDDRIRDYVKNHGNEVRTNTGLGPGDIENMFRAAQLKRHLSALGVSGNEAVLFNAATHPDAAANVARLRLTQSEVGTYLRNPDFYGEHRAGFVTRSLFLAPEGQAFRNALADDSGFKIGRFVIRDNWNSTAGLGLDATQRAKLTAYLHNHGGSPATLAGQLSTVENDQYVKNVMKHY